MSVYDFGVLASIRHWLQRHHSDANRALSRTRFNARWSPDFVHDQLAHKKSGRHRITQHPNEFQGTSGTELTKMQGAVQRPGAISRTRRSPSQLPATHNKIEVAPLPSGISWIFFAGETPATAISRFRRASPLDRPFKRSPSEQPLRVFLGSSLSGGLRSMWADCCGRAPLLRPRLR